MLQFPNSNLVRSFMIQKIVNKLILLFLWVHKPNSIQNQTLNKFIVQTIQEFEKFISLIKFFLNFRVSRITSKFRSFFTLVKMKPTVVIRCVASLAIRPFQIQPVIFSGIVIIRIFSLEKNQWAWGWGVISFSYWDWFYCSELLIESFF